MPPTGIRAYLLSQNGAHHIVRQMLLLVCLTSNADLDVDMNLFSDSLTDAMANDITSRTMRTMYENESV